MHVSGTNTGKNKKVAALKKGRLITYTLPSSKSSGLEELLSLWDGCPRHPKANGCDRQWPPSTGFCFMGETARTTSGQMGTRGGRTGFLLLQTLRSCGLRFPSDSQDLTWVEGWRKEGHVLHVVLPQPLPQGKHLPHAHTGQLPSKHAALRRGETGRRRAPFSPCPAPGGHPSCQWASGAGGVAHLQDGPLILRVKWRRWFRATSQTGDGVIKPSLRWDFQ